MPEHPYHVTVKVGRGTDFHAWTITKGAPAAYGPVDGLQITQATLDGLWPPTEAPRECRFQLIAAEFDDVPFVKLGAMVEVVVRTQAAGTLVASFGGRVAELTANPHDLGVLFTLLCVDFTTDLRGLPVTISEAWPAESVYSRFVRLVNAIGGYVAPPALGAVLAPNGASVAPANNGPLQSTYYFGPASSPSEVLDEPVQDAYEILQALLIQWPMDYPGYPDGGLARPQLVPVMGNGAMNPPTSWSVSPLWENPAYVGAHRLRWVNGLGYALQAAHTNDDSMLPASSVDFTSNYAETKDSSYNVVRVYNLAAGYEGGTPGDGYASLNIDPRIEVVLNCKSPNADARQAMADLYIPAEAPSVRWLADEFIYHGELDPPVPVVGPYRVQPELGAVVTITDIPRRHSPANRSYYSGMIANRVMTIANKSISIAVQLRRPDYAAYGPGVIRWNSTVLATIGAGATAVPRWSNIDQAITWDDLRQLRGTTT